MYYNTQVESDQYVDCVIGTSNSSRTDLSDLTAKTAAESSNLDTVIGFRCAGREILRYRSLCYLRRVCEVVQLRNFQVSKVQRFNASSKRDPSETG